MKNEQLLFSIYVAFRLYMLPRLFFITPPERHGAERGVRSKMRTKLKMKFSNNPLITRLVLCISMSLLASTYAADTVLDTKIAIPYQRFVLKNGLTLLVHEDHKAPIIAVNTWYHVGSKNEVPGKTGFAHLFEHLLPKLLAAQTPTPAKDLERLLVRFLQSPRFHSSLELVTARGRVLLNPVLSQQTVHSNPLWPMFGCGQIPDQAAPRISQESLVGFEQPCSHRIQVHVVTGRPQIAVAAAVHQQRLVSAAKHVTEEFLPMV